MISRRSFFGLASSLPFAAIAIERIPSRAAPIAFGNPRNFPSVEFLVREGEIERGATIPFSPLELNELARRFVPSAAKSRRQHFNLNLN